MVAALIEDDAIDRMWRARAAAILAEVSYAAPLHDRRPMLIDIAFSLSDGLDEPLPQLMVHIGCGAHPTAQTGPLRPTDACVPPNPIAPSKMLGLGCTPSVEWRDGFREMAKTSFPDLYKG